MAVISKPYVPSSRLLEEFLFNLIEIMLRVFENRVLRGIFGPKRDGVTG